MAGLDYAGDHRRDGRGAGAGSGAPGPDLSGDAGAAAAHRVLAPQEAFAGFSNPAVLTVAALFVVAAGLQRTEALAFVDRILFPRRPSTGRAVLRLMAPVSALSAFLNNTPIVAMLMPRVQQWAERHDMAPSKLLIPLSYAAIVGGMITLIGTSTNLVISGLMIQAGLPGLRMFDLTWVGLPVAVAVILFFCADRTPAASGPTARSGWLRGGLKECLFELRVTPGGYLEGKTVEEAGLRALGEAYLVHIRRAGRVIPAAPEQVLQGGDILAFVGSARMIERLLERDGWSGRCRRWKKTPHRRSRFSRPSWRLRRTWWAKRFARCSSGSNTEASCWASSGRVSASWGRWDAFRSRQATCC